MKQWQETGNYDNQYSWVRRRIFQNQSNDGRLAEVYVGKDENKYYITFELRDYFKDIDVFLRHFRAKKVFASRKDVTGFELIVDKSRKQKIDNLLDAVNEIEPIAPEFLLRLKEEFDLLRKRPVKSIENEIKQFYINGDFDKALDTAVEAEKLTYSNMILFLASLCSQEKDLSNYCEAVLKLNDDQPAFELANAFFSGYGLEIFLNRREQLQMALRLACKAAEIKDKKISLKDRIFHELCNPGQGVQVTKFNNIPFSNADFLIKLSDVLCGKNQTIEKLEKENKLLKLKDEKHVSVKSNQNDINQIRLFSKQAQDNNSSAQEIVATMNPNLLFG